MKPHPRNRKPVRKKTIRPGGAPKTPSAAKVLKDAVAVAEARGSEILEATSQENGKLRIVVDREDGPVDSAYLVGTIKAIRKALNKKGIDPGLFQIEVDSPGHHRILKVAKHFDRFRGATIRVCRKNEDGKTENETMTLLGSTGGAARVRTSEGQEQTLTPDQYDSIRLISDTGK